MAEFLDKNDKQNTLRFVPQLGGSTAPTIRIDDPYGGGGVFMFGTVEDVKAFIAELSSYLPKENEK